jgi:hypothetical protein
MPLRYLLAILLCPALLFHGVLLRGEVISADDHLSVHPLFQEEAGGAVFNPSMSDPAVQFSALRLRVVDSLAHFRSPLWNPDIYGGAPLIGDGQSMVASPATWFHVVLPEDLAQNAGVWWRFAWLGIGVWLLMARFGFSPFQSFVASVAAMAGPYLSVWLLHPHSATYVWIPWVLWAMERARGFKEKRFWLGLPAIAITTAGLLCGGHPETAAHGAIIASVYAVIRYRMALVGMVVGGLLSAPILGPLLEEISRSATLSEHGSNSLAFSQLGDLVWPHLQGHPTLEAYTGSGVWADGVIGPGVGVWLCLLLGWRSTFVRKCLAAWALCVAVALFVEIGPLNNARLGGIGAIWLALGAGASIKSGRFKTLAIPVLMFSWLHARDLDHHTIPSGEHAPSPSQWAIELEAQAADSRVTGLGWVLAPNTGALAGLKDIRGYDLPVSKDWERFAKRLDRRLVRPNFPIEQLNTQNSRLLRFAGVRYVVSDGEISGLAEVDVGVAPVNVYELDASATRAWLASSVRSVSSPEQAIDGIASGRFDRSTPPVEGFSESLTGVGGVTALKVIEHSPEEIEIQISPTERSILVFTDAWHSGWMAEVDGVQREVLRVGGYFKGVIVEPTESRVIFVFSPSGWRWGKRFGWVGLLALSALLLLPRLTPGAGILRSRRVGEGTG